MVYLHLLELAQKPAFFVVGIRLACDGPDPGSGVFGPGDEDGLVGGERHHVDSVQVTAQLLRQLALALLLHLAGWK